MRIQTSVKNAIRRGHIMVNVPALIALFGIPSLIYYLQGLYEIPEWAFPISFGLALVFAWLIWSIMITKWRLWAFDNVRNVHELKKCAIREKLLWPDGSPFEKTEIRTKHDKKKLIKLDKKFNQPDLFKEDYTLPSVTEIRFSKIYLSFHIGVPLLLFSGGFLLISSDESLTIFYGIVSFVFGSIGLYQGLPKAFQKKSIIKLDSKGIETINIGFKSWSTIENENVIQEGFGKTSATYLIFNYDCGQSEKIQTDTLNINYSELTNLINTYRIRYNKMIG